MSLTFGHLKATNRLCFLSLLCFHESGIISRYRIILVSPHFSSFTSLVQIIPLHRIILIFTHLSTFIRLFSTSQHRTAWRKASSQSDIRLRVLLLVFLVRSELKSSFGYIIFRTPTQSSWSLIQSTRCTWTRLLSNMSPTRLTRHFHWGITSALFNLGNVYLSCYVTHATYTVCQRDLQVSIWSLWIGNYNCWVVIL